MQTYKKKFLKIAVKLKCAEDRVLFIYTSPGPTTVTGTCKELNIYMIGWIEESHSSTAQEKETWEPFQE